MNPHPANPADPPAPPSFQNRVDAWLHACFGADIARDKIERNHRFLEEALETVQSGECTRSEAHQLVDYVYDREVGDLKQEVGGVMNTLAALCLAHGLDMDEAAETELARVWAKVEKIRAKQAAKPKHSPLPEASATAPPAPPTVDISSEAVAAIRSMRSAAANILRERSLIAWKTADESKGEKARMAQAFGMELAELFATIIHLPIPGEPMQDPRDVEIDRLRTFVRSARGIVAEYVREHPKLVLQGSYQGDPMGAHAWLAAESAEIGTARDGCDPKVETRT